jgi:hypothetical protein
MTLFLEIQMQLRQEKRAVGDFQPSFSVERRRKKSGQPVDGRG